MGDMGAAAALRSRGSASSPSDSNQHSIQIILQSFIIIGGCVWGGGVLCSQYIKYLGHDSNFFYPREVVTLLSCSPYSFLLQTLYHSFGGVGEGSR